MPVSKGALPADPTNGYFVYLPDIKVTINLTQIAYVEWTIVADPKIDPMFISTVTLAGGGGFYLTKEGSELLWDALQVFNQRQVQPGIALNRIYDLLFWQSHNPSQTTDATDIPATEDANFTSNPAATANSPAATSRTFSGTSQINIGKAQVKTGVTS